MAESALGAVYRTIRTALSGNALWEDRVYALRAPKAKTRPYVVFFMASGADRQETHTPTASIVVTIKCVADDLAVALDGQQRIADVLDDAGSQDIGTNTVAVLDSWDITTITIDRIVEVPDYDSETDQAIWHYGNQYRFELEQK